MNHDSMPHGPTSNDIRILCTYRFDDGHRCGSPAMRGERRCYYHHDLRKPVRNLKARNARRAIRVTLPTDRRALQASLHEVIQRIGANQIDPRRAGMLLYALQIAENSLP